MSDEARHASTGHVLAGLLLAAIGTAQGLLWWLIIGLSEENDDSWQRHAMGWLAFGCFVTCLLCAVALARRQVGVGALWLLAALATEIATWVLFATVS
jgi:hypothetical protein